MVDAFVEQLLKRKSQSASQRDPELRAAAVTLLDCADGAYIDLRLFGQAFQRPAEARAVVPNLFA